MQNTIDDKYTVRIMIVDEMWLFPAFINLWCMWFLSGSKNLFLFFFLMNITLSVSIYGNDKIERTNTGILLEIWL